MIGTRTSEGWEIVVRPHGFGRFFSAAFLGFWLCGWAVGEFFALWILTKGAWALLTGQPPDPGREPLELGPALAVGTFILVWGSFWTLGGILAISEFLRLVSSEDRLVAGPAGVIIHRRRGPFWSRRVVERDDVRRVYRLPHKSTLVLDTARGPVQFEGIRTLDEAEEALATLRREALLREDDPPGQNLPAGWEELRGPMGERLVVRDRGIRRAQTRVAIGAALAAATVAAVLIWESGRSPQVVPMVVIAGVVTVLLSAGAVWLARGRTEWVVERGRLIVRRRFASHAKDVFEARALSLRTHSDSDGDDWFTLDALAGGPGAKRKTLASVMHDPSDPAQLGAWLAERAGIPLDDAVRRAFSGRPA